MVTITEPRGVGPIRPAPSVRIKLKDGNPRHMGPCSNSGRAVCGKDRVGPMSCSSLAMTLLEVGTLSCNVLMLSCLQVPSAKCQVLR